MSKSQAQFVVERLAISPNTPEYIILYKPNSLPWSHPKELIYSFSAKLTPYMQGTQGRELSEVASLSDKKITFFSSNKTFDALQVQSDWGSQIYIYLSDKEAISVADTILKFTKWHNDLTKGVAKIAGIIVTITLAVVSFATEVRNLLLPILPDKKMNSMAGREKLKETLKMSYYLLPLRPQANGLFYWQYNEECSARTLIDSFSPFLKDDVLAEISIRSTTEDGWIGLVEAHKRGEAISVKRSTLTEGNALYQAMKKLGVTEVITVPVPLEISPCPIGYLSVGLYVEPTDEQRLAYIEEMQKVSASVNAWGRLALD